MGTRTYTVTFSAPGTAYLPQGRFFYIKQAAAALSIEARGPTAAPVLFENVGAGLKFGPVPFDKRWSQLVLTSASIQVVELVISDDAEVDIASTVTVSGSVSVQEQASTTLASPAAVNVTTGTASSIAANASRKRITLSALSANTGSLFVQAAGGGAGRGIELQPGTFVELRTTAAVDVRNDSGATQTYSTLEES